MLGKVGKMLTDAVKKFSSVLSPGRAEIERLAREVQRALVLADVDYKTAYELYKRIVERATSEKPGKGVTTKEHVLNIVYEELARILGEKGDFHIKKPIRIVLLGLYGSGKTTTAAKLAYWLKKHGILVKLVSLDRDRPAAYEQLKQLGDQIGVDVLREIPQEGSFIVDTAGRDAINQEMLEEARKIVEEVKPDEVFLVIPAEMGHKAKAQAEAMKDLITGVIITRMDGSAKGGGALAACKSAGVNVKFIGTGEKIDALEVFDAKKFVSRLLGVPDLEGIIEKVKEAGITVSKEDIEEFSLMTFYKQLEAITKMGPLEQIFQMMGLSDIRQEDLEETKKKLKKYKAIIDSMTKEERRDPKIINRSRMERIARGSGTTVEDVKALLKEYFMAKKMMKQVMRKQRRLGKWMPRFQP